MDFSVLCSILLIRLAWVYSEIKHSNNAGGKLYSTTSAFSLDFLNSFQQNPASDFRILDTSNELISSLSLWTLSKPTTLTTVIRMRKLPRTTKVLRELGGSNRFLPHHSIHLIHAVGSELENIETYLEIERDYGSPQRDHFILAGESVTTQRVLSSEVASHLKYIFASERYAQDGNLALVNIRGQKISALAGKVPTYFQVDSQGQACGGSHYIALVAIAKAYNLTAIVTTQAVGTGVLKNSTWNGMTGAVYYRKFDVGLLQSATFARSGIMDFVFVQFSTVLFTTKCAGREVVSGSILAPFKTQVWCSIAISFVAISIATYVILKHYHNDQDIIVFTVFIPYQIALDQGFDIQIPRGLKTLSAIWMFSIVIINTAYRSDLIKYFSFPKFELIPQDLQQLDKMENYTVIFNYNGGTAYDYFIAASSGILKRIRDRFEKLEKSMETCVVASALNEKTVCISWDLNVRPIIGKNLTLPGAFEPCVVFSKPVLTFSSGITLTRNSIYTDAFVRAIGRIRDSGLIERWNQDVVNHFSVVGKNWYQNNRGEIYNRIVAAWMSHHTQDSFLKLQNISTAFMLWILFLMVSLSMFGVEIASTRIRHGFCKRNHGKEENVVGDQYQTQHANFATSYWKVMRKPFRSDGELTHSHIDSVSKSSAVPLVI